VPSRGIPRPEDQEPGHLVRGLQGQVFGMAMLEVHHVSTTARSTNCWLLILVNSLFCLKCPHLPDGSTDALTLVPISKLEAYLNDLRTQTAEASGALTHLLQARDTLQQDSDMFNKLIGDLVVEAQKRATGGKGGRSTPARQGTR
jgi:hypothetical protein